MKRNRISTFLGGIHPTDGSDKQLSKDKTILKYIPDIVEISMEQSYGGFCEPVVKAGEKVKKGQLIGCLLYTSMWEYYRLDIAVCQGSNHVSMDPMQITLLFCINFLTWRTSNAKIKSHFGFVLNCLFCIYCG